MISFDVKSKFTNGLLEKSIYRLYFERGVWWKENPDKHSKNSLKIITLTLHKSYISLSITTSMWWSCNGLSLVPLLANINRGRSNTDIKIMSLQLETYVDDMHAYVEPTKAKLILNKLNSYPPNINFTFKDQNTLHD